MIGAIVIICLGAWWYMSSKSTYQQATTNGTQFGTTGTQPTTGTTGTTQTTTTSVTSVSNTSNSDAALVSDMTSVDAQMSGLDSDSASADQGLSNPNQ